MIHVLFQCGRKLTLSLSFRAQIIARLVVACRPYVYFSQLLTEQQLQQLIRLIVWKEQQQPWTVHAITCLLQDILEADKQYDAVRNAARAFALATAVGTDDTGPDAMQLDDDEAMTPTAPESGIGASCASGQTDDEMNIAEAQQMWATNPANPMQTNMNKSSKYCGCFESNKSV